MKFQTNVLQVGLSFQEKNSLAPLLSATINPLQVLTSYHGVISRLSLKTIHVWTKS